jgi:hypothetical protein
MTQPFPQQSLALPRDAFMDLAFDIAAQPAIWSHLCGAPPLSLSSSSSSDIAAAKKDDVVRDAIWRTLEQARANAFIIAVTPTPTPAASGKDQQKSESKTDNNDISSSTREASPSSITVTLALYASISAVNHSCEPNSVMINGSLYSVFDIDNGDDITISYIRADDLARPTHERRTIILQQHGFICACVACTRPDESSSSSSLPLSLPARWNIDEWSERVLALRAKNDDSLPLSSSSSSSFAS